MSRQVLGEKRTRHYARLTGLPIERMLARGGRDHWILFRTKYDQHGQVNTRTLEVLWYDSTMHWSSCKDDHPEGATLGPGERDSAHP